MPNGPFKQLRQKTRAGIRANRTLGARAQKTPDAIIQRREAVWKYRASKAIEEARTIGTPGQKEPDRVYVLRDIQRAIRDAKNPEDMATRMNNLVLESMRKGETWEQAGRRIIEFRKTTHRSLFTK